MLNFESNINEPHDLFGAYFIFLTLFSIHGVPFYKISDIMPVVMCLFFGKLDKTKIIYLTQKNKQNVQFKFFLVVVPKNEKKIGKNIKNIFFCI